MKTTKIPEHTCTCGYKNDRTSSAFSESNPSQGDVSICFGCGKIWLFNEDLTQREPTAKEQEEMMASPEWPQILRAREAVLMGV